MSEKIKNFEALQKELKEKFNFINADDKEILSYVSHNNYYLLGKYWYKFSRNGEEKRPRLDFKEIQAPYIFDKKLSLLLLKYLLVLENSFKSIFVNKLICSANHYFPHLSEKHFNIENYIFRKILKITLDVILKDSDRNKTGRAYLESLKENYGNATENIAENDYNKVFEFLLKDEYSKDVKTIKESTQNYIAAKNTINQSPLFILVDLFDFRDTINLYIGMKNTKLKEEIAELYGCNNTDEFKKILNYLCFLRNRCAHPARNYCAFDFKEVNKEIISSFTEDLIRLEDYEENSISIHIAILQYFLKKIEYVDFIDDKSFIQEFKLLIERFSKYSFPRYEKASKGIEKKTHCILLSMGFKEYESVWKQDLWK